MKTTLIQRFCLFVFAMSLVGCEETLWNNPYPAADQHKNYLYSAFDEQPKHLDPARSYVSTEYALIEQIYQPPVQYHFLKRPYQLVPLTVEKVPVPQFFDANNQPLPSDIDPSKVAYTLYELQVKPGFFYQPHPALAKDEQGKYRYHALQPQDLDAKFVLSDFPHEGTRELVAADYVYQIKRLAHPRVHSPLLALMAEYILGLGEYAEKLSKVYAKMPADQRESSFMDLDQFPLAGAEVVDRYRYRIKIKGVYPQFVYWLAMPFFSPMPEEAERFYSQPGMADKNFTLDWYPIGTGPYRLTENNPNLRMVLERNPNFKGEPYPTEGMPGDQEAGLLEDAGKMMPFVDKQIVVLEKESIPYWNKFLQGYYDVSGISSDSFDQAIQFDASGDASLTDEMKDKNIRLQTSVLPSISYMGFNMLDPLVGGLSEAKVKLRQAISIAVDQEEFIEIFLNGRGITAQGPLPPGIFGYEEGEKGLNHFVYDWVQGKPKRKSIEEAKKLLADAGYPGGIDLKTGKALQINYEVVATGPDDNAQVNWWIKQFRKLGIELVIRRTDFNRFQEKMLKGDAQFFTWGWNADYPDPENFLFLLYGENAKVGKNGENAANYANPAFDALYQRMKNMASGPERQQLIHQMVEVLRHDSPWVWGFHPKAFALYHQWVKNSKPMAMGKNVLKYKRVDGKAREAMRKKWNHPITTPIWIGLFLLVVSLIPAWISYRRRANQRLGVGPSC